MIKEPSPERWAYDLTHVLNAAFGKDRFPTDVARLAMDYSRQRFPDEPILDVKGDSLPGFEGALYRRPKGWVILYNDAMASEGRINFTLAHELGHYLLHRKKYPDGFECNSQDVAPWDSEYGQIEYQANVFAANLLMPLDDFRRQIPANQKADFTAVQVCAERYNVSLLAATLRWLEYTDRRAILVVSTDDFILRAKSSKPALRSGAYFKTSGGPIEIPIQSLPRNPMALVNGRAQLSHPAGVWLREPVEEHTIRSVKLAFSMSLLLLGSEAPTFERPGGWEEMRSS